jgi:hypothetical protein
MINKKLNAARALLARKSKSKATALKLYLKEHIGLLHNPVTDEMRQELSATIALVKGRNVPAIREICRDCVGNVSDGNCAKLIRDCEITSCFLYTVRPHQPKKISLEVDDGFRSSHADWES